MPFSGIQDKLIINYIQLPHLILTIVLTSSKHSVLGLLTSRTLSSAMPCAVVQCHDRRKSFDVSVTVPSNRQHINWVVATWWPSGALEWLRMWALVDSQRQSIAGIPSHKSESGNSTSPVTIEHGHWVRWFSYKNGEYLAVKLAGIILGGVAWTPTYPQSRVR